MKSENLTSAVVKSALTEEESKRITSLRFLLIVFVVFIHVLPDGYTIYENKNAWVFIRTSFLSLCNTAVLKLYQTVLYNFLQ